jgi:hypothetical protein
METATLGDRSDWARWLNLVLGGWLFFSAFLWPHAYRLQTSTWGLGMLIAVFAVLASALPAMRWANSFFALGVLMTAGLALLHGDMHTLVNNGLVGLAVFGLSLVGPSSVAHPRHDYVDVW